MQLQSFFIVECYEKCSKGEKSALDKLPGQGI